MSTDAPILIPVPLAWLVTHWRPGSHDWTWLDEYNDLLGDPRTLAIERRVVDEGVGFMDHVAPILLGSDGRVWDGHHRIVLAMKYGIGWVMVEGSVDPALVPAPSVVPEAAVAGLDYTDIANRAQSATGRSIWPSTAEAVIAAALSYLTAAPSATREATEDEVTEVVTEALTDAYRAEHGMSRHTGLTAHDESVIRDQAARVVNLADARFTITPKEDR